MSWERIKGGEKEKQAVNAQQRGRIILRWGGCEGT